MSSRPPQQASASRADRADQITTYNHTRLAAFAVGTAADTTVSGMLIPAGTIYDGTVVKVSSDGVFELLLAYEHVVALHSDDPAIAIAVLTAFAPRHE